MARLPDFGLTASAWTRLALGGGFCALAVALVWLVERPSAAPPPAAAPSAGAVRMQRLAVESTYPVAQWRVLVLNAAQTPTASDAWSWHGSVAVPSGEDVVVIAVAGPDAPASPHRGLRLRLGDRPERIVWGAGDVVAAETAP